jgi:hypothetical protein
MQKTVEYVAGLTLTHAVVGIFTAWFPESYTYWVNLALAGFIVMVLAGVKSSEIIKKVA